MKTEQQIKKSNEDFAKVKAVMEKWLIPLPENWDVRFTHIFNDLKELERSQDLSDEFIDLNYQDWLGKSTVRFNTTNAKCGWRVLSKIN